MKELALSQELYKPNALPAKAKRSDNMNNYKKKQHDFPVSVIYISKTDGKIRGVNQSRSF